MDTMKAASDTCNCVNTKEYPAARGREGNTVEHAVWMLAGICLGYVQHEKAHRWLGYAQGIIVMSGMLNLEQVKGINSGSWKGTEE